MLYQKQVFISGLFAVLTLTSSQVSAERLFAVTFGEPSFLVNVDPVTGATNTIGPIGHRVNGLSYDETTGTLYATTSRKTSSTFPGNLLSINQITGAGTPIGTGGGEPGTVSLLASNSAGQLYGWLKASPNRLISWDKATGNATIIGTPGITASKHGIAFDNDDNLLLFNDDVIHQINTTTGVSTVLGAITNSGTPNDIAHHGDINPVNNKYYGLDTIGGGAKNLLIINPVTRELESTISTGNDLFALAFAPDAILGECDGTGGFSVNDIVCTIDKAIDASPNATLGECDNVSGLNQQDVTCSIDKALGPQL